MDDSETSWCQEVLARPPLQVGDDTAEHTLIAELKERIAALLESHNGLEPNESGWRNLAIALALKYEPAFQIETPVDRTGRSGIGGRPIGFENFAARSAVKAEIKKGRSVSDASEIVSKASGRRYSKKTLINIVSKEPIPSDFVRKLPYELKATVAAEKAAADISQQCHDIHGKTETP